MKILILSSRIPYPLTAGFRIRIFNTAKYLKNNGHQVDLLFLGNREEYAKYKNDLQTVFKNLYMIPFSKTEAVFHVLKCLISPAIPFQVQLYQNRSFKKKLLDIADEYDLVIGNHIRTSEYLKLLPPNKVILDMHDAISYNYLNAIKVSSGLKKLIYQLEYKRVLNYECEIASYFKRVVLISRKDRDWLAKNGADISHIMLIPVAVRDDIQHEKNDYENDEEAICFLGKMSYQPNVDAVLWFSKYVFPRLQKKFSTLKFYILGIDPTPEVKALEKNLNIQVTGFLDDPFELMARCKATVVPIRNGAGIQNKVLESMLVGTPVVSSQIAADGIDAKDGQQLLIAQDTDDFVNKVGLLVKSTEKRRYIGEAGQKYIKDNYTWDSIWQKWNSLISEENRDL